VHFNRGPRAASKSQDPGALDGFIEVPERPIIVVILQSIQCDIDEAQVLDEFSGTALQSRKCASSGDRSWAG
jgi:hypothetical protein